MKQSRWDIFCNVIDNFGDIGVCWRLARQLASEGGGNRRVRLWIDQPDRLQALCPAFDLERAHTEHEQFVQGLFVRSWPPDFPILSDDEVADIVIEAFACTLPEAYLSAMARREKKPRWINLEYLSAESWVANCHQGRSPHPKLPLTRHFFFPGFEATTGGLLREPGLFERRDHWRVLHSLAEQGQQLGLPDKDMADESSLKVSLFAYPNPVLPVLLQCWVEGQQSVHCLVPEGLALSQIRKLPDFSALTQGKPMRRGRLTLHALPFVPQEDFDLLLWHCDLNFVRGEDSLVRAQWAARPMIWHIYPQEEAAHLAKLKAFLEHYTASLDEAPARALYDFWEMWNAEYATNSPEKEKVRARWQAFSDHLPRIRAHTEDWCTRLSRQEDLATQLIRFCEKQI